MSTDGPAVRLTRRDAVATIEIDNPQQRNALSFAMVDQFHAALDEIEADATLGAVVVRGAAGTFCSGLARDAIGAQRADPVSSASTRRSTHVYATFTRLGALPVPTFAAVRGAAVGAGLNLALAPDLRIVADDARLRAGFTRIGLHPGGGFFALASSRMGREAAMALGVAGEELAGAEAAARGWAWRALPDGQVEDATHALAARCAQDPELARATVRSFRTIAGPPALPWASAVEIERAPQAWTFRRLVEREEQATADDQTAARGRSARDDAAGRAGHREGGTA
ncbi:MAG: enoyl-CoA hydratase/isomerase family protein [Patulibacter sp.]|nr:enoyl-CoA hydratase/isomerase family protein [Patulibacter sp.]